MKKLIFYLLADIIIAIPINCNALNLSQIITEARTLALDASSPTRQRFSDSQLTTFINQAQRDALAQTKCLRNAITFQLVPGTTFYPLPTDYLTMERLTIGYKYIQEMSPAALDGRSRGWQTSSGYPTYYFINFSTPSMIGFAPWPAQAADTDTIRIEYDVQPTDMVNNTDSPFNGLTKMTDYHHSLAYFTAAMMSAIDGQAQRSKLYLDMYTAVIGSMAKTCLSRPAYLPSATGTP